MRSVFTGKAPTYNNLTLLADHFRKKHGDAAKEIVGILIATTDFLTSTATEAEYQVNRNKRIKENEIVSLLDNPGVLLQVYYDNHKHHQEAVDAMNFCARAILEQLQALKNKDDKIYQYYEAHDNSLKTFLLNIQVELNNRVNKKL